MKTGAQKSSVLKNCETPGAVYKKGKKERKSAKKVLDKVKMRWYIIKALARGGKSQR